MVGCRKDRGLYDGRYVSGARKGLELGATEEGKVEVMCQEPGSCWR